MDERILELVAKGRARIEAREKAAEAQREAERQQKRDDWLALQAAVRQAFPEAVREFVLLEEAKNEDPTCWPGDQRIQYPYIEIPSFAPIKCTAALGEDGTWKQIHNKDRYNGIQRGMYQVYAPRRDWEFGIVWELNYGEETETLEEALAHAVTSGEKRREMEQEEALRAKAQAEYVPIEDAPAMNGLMDELIKMIRDVTREEIARQAD